MKTPEDILFDRVDWKCAICHAPKGTCDCWEQCLCGSLHEKGQRCRNPKCSYSEAGAEALIQSAMRCILDDFNSGVADMTEEECFAADGATLANDLIIAAHERTLSIDDAVNSILSYMHMEDSLRRAYLTGFLRELFTDRIGGAA